MTDPIDCPDCGGTGRDEHSVPGLGLQCGFYGGRGWVGGEHEPGEDHAPCIEPADVPAWDEPGAAPWGAMGCTRCLGSGRIRTLGGRITGGMATAGREMDCPQCRPQRAAG